MAVINGSFSGTNTYLSIYLDVSIVQSITNNQTTVTQKLIIGVKSPVSTYKQSTPYNSVIAGVIVASGNYNFNAGGASVGATWIIANNSKVLDHNADGTYGTNNQVSLSGRFDLSGTTAGVGTVSGSITIPIIPRTSEPTLSSTDFNIGDSITINTNRASSTFTHRIRLVFGSFSKTLAENVGVSYSWNTSLDANSMYAVIPNDNNGKGTIYLDTYSGTTLIGTSKPVEFKANIINADPLFSSGNISFKDTNAATFAITGNNQKIIQGYSNLEISINTKATPQKSATLGTNAYSFIVTGRTPLYGNHGDLLPIVRTFTAMALNQFTVGATDSRKNTTNNLFTIAGFVPYTKPVVSNFSVTRVNPNLTGTTTLLAVNGTFTNWTGLSQNNTILTARYRYRVVGGTYGSYINIGLTENTNGKFSFNANISGTFTATSAYQFEIDIIDRLGTTTSTATLQSILPTQHLDIENRRIGVGKIADTTLPAGSLDVSATIKGLAFSGLPVSSTTASGIVQLNNNLTSTSTTLALTANQGYVLNQALNSLDQKNIYDSGSNANGSYIRFNNGIMLCFRSLAYTANADFTLDGSFFYYKQLGAWTYPIAFISKPAVTINVNASNVTRRMWGFAQILSNTAVSQVVVATYWNASDAGGDVSLTAIGRWK